MAESWVAGSSMLSWINFSMYTAYIHVCFKTWCISYILLPCVWYDVYVFVCGTCTWGTLSAHVRVRGLSHSLETRNFLCGVSLAMQWALRRCLFMLSLQDEITGMHTMPGFLHPCWELNSGPPGGTASAATNWAISLLGYRRRLGRLVYQRLVHK